MVTTVKQYKKKIWTYEKRLKRYYKISRRLRNDICKMKKQLVGIEKNEKKQNKRITKLVESINDYFEVNIASKNIDNSHKLARSVYFKIGIEKKMRQTDLCRAIKRRGWSKTASSSRMRFTKSFKTNPENKEIFYNFKNFFETK